MVTIHEDNPMARKTHRCDMCGRTIRLGEQYHRQDNVAPGWHRYRFRSCVHCSEFVRLVDFDPGDGNGFGPDDVTEHDPRDWTEARWLVQWRRKWTRRDGELYPVPAVHLDRPTP